MSELSGFLRRLKSKKSWDCDLPTEHLREAGLEEEAAKVALELLEPIRAKIEAAAYELLRKGVPPDRVRERLGRKLAF